jgi:hypothetical protein
MPAISAIMWVGTRFFSCPFLTSAQRRRKRMWRVLLSIDIGTTGLLRPPARIDIGRIYLGIGGGI